MDESKCRKTSEIFKARELPLNILVKSAQFNVKENLSKQKNIGILTWSPFTIPEAPSTKNIY